MTQEILYQKIESKLRSNNYSDSTINLYKAGVKRFIKFTEKQDVLTIDNSDLAKFSHLLYKNKKLKYGTIRPIKFGIQYAFNNILKLDLDIELIPSPKSKTIQKEYLTKKEITQFFLSIDNLKHKTIFQFMYALGLDVGEVSNVKITDIDSNKKIVLIRDTSNDISREAYLSASILEQIRTYFKVYLPKVFLFEGAKKGEPISERSLQHTFKISLDKSGLNKSLTTRSLKHSYVKHLTEDGLNLNSILEHLNIKSLQSLKQFIDICYPIEKFNTSPLDSLSIEKDEFEFFDTTDLEHLLIKISDKEEKEYLLEGIKCFKANALRAGVIFLWNTTIHKIQVKCMTKPLGQVNAEIKKIYQKAKDIKVVDDFDFIKDEYLLDLACNLKLIDKASKEVLKSNCLDLRNRCGHPTKYKPKTMKIKAFVEDIIGIMY